jgi:hypothetical protein
MKEAIAILAWVGVLAILWVILPHWIVGVVGFFSASGFFFLRDQLDK